MFLNHICLLVCPFSYQASTLDINDIAVHNWAKKIVTIEFLEMVISLSFNEVFWKVVPLQALKMLSLGQ
jgi:hypothetical protein